MNLLRVSSRELAGINAAISADRKAHVRSAISLLIEWVETPHGPTLQRAHSALTIAIEYDSVQCGLQAQPIGGEQG
jgi:hypothetical protein